MSESQFWGSTPKQLSIHSRAWNFTQEQGFQLAGWAAWNGAALQRCKRMPTIKTFLNFKKNEPMTLQEQLRKVESLNQFFGGKDKRNG